MSKIKTPLEAIICILNKADTLKIISERVLQELMKVMLSTKHLNYNNT